jgi:paired amphipathic helix protein Sin3a
MRELRVEDALMYLDQVKMEFGDRPQIYNEFLDIMKTFKSQEIDTPGVIRRVAALFHGNKRLVLGFNTFLPEGYRIELPLDGSPFPVYREPGRSGVTQIPLPGNPNLPPSAAQPPRPGMPTAKAPGGMLRPPPPPSSTLPPPGSAAVTRPGPSGTAGMPPPRGPPFPAGGVASSSPPGPSKFTSAQKPASSPTGQDEVPQPVEFDHAINYVTTIKKRFHAHPEIYRKFLEILHTYQKEQRGIKEVLDEVSLLFADHADLLKEFTYFLPDGVQSQAKAQLEAEERAKQRVAQAKAIGKGMSPMVGSPAGSAGTPSNFAPSPAGGMILPPPPAASLSDSVHKRMPSVPSNIPRTPFGATKGRSEDRENEIAATAKYGKVSFDPVRPPRR